MCAVLGTMPFRIGKNEWVFPKIRWYRAARSGFGLTRYGIHHASISPAIPEPIVEPARSRSAEVADAEDQSHGEERRLNECGDEKIPYRNFAANRGGVIESGPAAPSRAAPGTAHEKPAAQLRSVRARRIRIFTTKDTKVAEKSHC